MARDGNHAWLKRGSCVLGRHGGAGRHADEEALPCVRQGDAALSVREAVLPPLRIPLRKVRAPRPAPTGTDGVERGIGRSDLDGPGPTAYRTIGSHDRITGQARDVVVDATCPERSCADLSSQSA